MIHPIRYIKNYIQGHRYRSLINRYLIEANNAEKSFNVGDTVEYIGGGVGEVLMVYIDLKTNKPVGCAVRWKKNRSAGAEISLFLPVSDMGEKFNPLLRLKHSK